ncbi:MAG TPA: AEC family transporter [Lautropia sp.]|jgi:predicted permease|nr:AEC family transporter [Lautropia sp.]
MTLLEALGLAFPLYLLILIGYLLARFAGWPKAVPEALSRFVFVVAIPALLFALTSDLSRLPPLDLRVLLAYFGACLLVFVAGRLVAARLFRLDGVGQTVFAMGGIYGNTVMLGLPIARAALGEGAVPTLALVLVTNTLVMWTLVTVSVEWARGGRLTPGGLLRTVRSVVTNPVVAAILLGTGWSLTRLPLPSAVKSTLDLLGQSAVPLALVTVGFGLAAYRIREGIAEAVVLTGLKLVALPFLVWLIARVIGLPPLETQVVVLLASIALGVNVYLMAAEFKTLQGPIGTGLLVSTMVSGLTVPLVLLLTAA